MSNMVLAAALITTLVQDTGSEVARQRALVDSLLPQWRAVSREMMRADSLERARRQGRDIAVDTATIGPFIVIAPDNEAAEHFRNFRRAVRERAAMLRGIPAAERMKLFVQRDGGGALLRFQAERGNGTLVRIFGGSPRVRERFTRIAVDDAIYRYLPPAVRTWLGSAQLGRGRERANVYREMATSPSPTVRACHRGEASSCITALGLSGKDTAAASFGHTARASFLMHALATGQGGAVVRLSAARGSSAAGALEQVSGRPMHQLVADWRSRIASEYVSYAGLSRASAAALLWAGIAMLLALRSTRRRAG